jgi:methylglutaconyl-CoA hydratase
MSNHLTGGNMKYKTIEVERENDLATVTLNRPDMHNAMNEELMKELTACFNNLSTDENIRVVILTGNGKSFCAGADLNWMKSMANYSEEENIRDSRLLLELYEAIYTCPKPVIGRINGHAFGGGLGLIAVCDLTIGVPGKKFAFSEAKLGIIPSVISTYIVRRIGLANMRRLFITGERFTSDHAKDIGILDYVVPEEEFDEMVQKYVDQLRSSGPKAIKEAKNLVSKCEQMDRGAYKEFTVDKIAELRVSNEGQEGINAFLEKRKTTWSE